MGLVDMAKNILGLQPEPNTEASNFAPFKTKDEAVDFVNKEFKKRQELKRDYELRWMLNINFLNNNQYCDINLTAKNIYQQTPAYDWQEMEVYNQIRIIFEARLAALKKNRPLPFVRPSGNETRDIATANISKRVLRGLDANVDMNKIRPMVNAWSELTGCCFIKHRWNPNAGNYLGSDNQGDVYDGDIEKYIVNSFEMFPDNNFANGLTGCKSIIHARPMSVDDIWEEWDVVVKGRKVDVFTLSQSNIGGGLGYYTTNPKVTATTMDDAEIVKELMLLPCKKYPQGLNIIVAGTTLLHIGPFVYRIGKNGAYGLPFEMQMCIENPGFFWPTSIIERLIPIQRAYNAIKNRKHEILNRKAIGNLAVQDDGNVDVEELQREGLFPGKIHLYSRDGKAPMFIENKDSTTDFAQEEESLRNEFAMISGVSPFSSQSQLPGGVVSGDAIEQIKESDESRITLAKENINQAAIEGWKIDLRMYRQFAPQGPRLLKYVGENNQVDLAEWYKSDLTSDDIIIDNEDELSQTPAQLRLMATQMLQYGLFDETKVSPQVRNKFLKTYKMGNWEDIDDVEELHANKARWENRMLMQGSEPDPSDYDLHSIHIPEHNRQRLDISYIDFKRQNPELAAMFDQHVKWHEQIEQANAQAQAQQMNPQKGPSESMTYDKLPVTGKIQMASKAGIELTPKDIVQQIQLEQKMKEKPIQQTQQAG